MRRESRGMKRATLVLALLLLPAVPASAAPPSNDNWQQAQEIASFPVTLDVNLAEASTGAHELDCAGGSLAGAPTEAVWYRLDLPQVYGLVRIRYTEGRAIVRLWDEQGATGVLTPTGCVYADDTYPVYTSGGVLFVSVGAAPTQDLEPFLLTIDAGTAAVPNDVSYRATRITSLPYETTQQTWGAEWDYDRDGCANGAYVWYTYTPAEAQTLEFSVTTTDTSFTSVSVYALGQEVRTLGCGAGYADEVSTVRSGVEADVPILIGIGDQGELTLSVRSLGPPEPGPDLRASAAPISYGTDVSFSTAGATIDGDDPLTCGSGGSLWYELPSLPRGSEVVMTGGGSIASIVGDEVVACATDGALALPAGSGATHLQVRSPVPITGTIFLHFDPPTGTRITDTSPFTPGCGDPLAQPYMNSEVEVSQAVDPHDPEHLVMTWQQDRHRDKGGANGIGAAVSFDGGATWATRTIPGVSRCSGGAFFRATDPWAAIDADGTAYVMSLGYNPGATNSDHGPNTVLLNRSEDGGLTWSEPIIVAISPGGVFHDKETLTADPNTPGLLYAVWDAYPTNLAFPVFSRSEDGGRTWTPPVPLPTTGSGAGDQIAVLDDGTLVEIAPRGSMQSITSRDRGLTWSTPSRIGSSPGREGPPGVRGGAGIPSVSTDGRSVYVSWSDTYFTYVARSDDAGTTWNVSRIGALNSQRFTTAVASARSGHLAVMTYMIDDKGQTWLNLATSSDGGADWSERPITDRFDMYRAPLSQGRGYFLGDYFGLVPSGDDVIAAFAAVPPGDKSNVSNVYSLRLTP